MDTYSLADLVEVTGAKRRSLQLWADRGVIKPLADTANAGTGVHRLFSREEAIIACLVQPFAAHQMSIGELVIIGSMIRSQLILGRRPGDQGTRLVEAIGGSGDTILVYETFLMGGALQRNMRLDEGKDIRFAARRHPESICMAIRLETYLSKLK